MQATTVAPKSGMAAFEAASIAAFLRSMPCCTRTMMPSATTMALSTIMPMAIISAPSDTRCKSIPPMVITMKVPKMGKMSPVMPMIMPTRSPMDNASTTSTMATASIRLIIKSLMESATRSDCQEIL